MPLRRHHPALALIVALVGGASLVAAQNSPDSRHITPSAAGIGFVVAAVLLFLLCCCIQRRRVAQRAKPPYVAPPLPLHAGSRFPHGMQYGTPLVAPAQYPYPSPAGGYPNALSEYPPAGAADWAPPPYVKEGGDVPGHYAPPPGPPPGFEATYSPPPGPPPRAHISVRLSPLPSACRSASAD
ncbi:hypothetical protein FB451DRAFT_1292699 [Mycena latifolia]|nr:hypothetical protein FB451DRAFT_1292699 [Mycena latifolia]